MRSRALAAGLLVAGVGLVARADDKPLDRADLDKRAALVAYNTSLLGTQLWGKQNYEGTFRLYQGSLYGLWAGLDHRPALAASVLKKLETAYGMRPEEGAFVLREALDAVQAETSGAAPAAKDPAEKKPAEKKPADTRPLKERLGGEKAVRAMMKEFVAAAAQDPKVNLMRGVKPDPDGKTLDFEGGMVELLDAAKPGETRLAGVFKVQKYTDEEFRLLLGHLAVALKKNSAGGREVIEVLEKVGQARPPAEKK